MLGCWVGVDPRRGLGYQSNMPCQKLVEELGKKLLDLSEGVIFWEMH